MLRRMLQHALLACPDVRGKTWLLRHLGNAIHEVRDAGRMSLSPVHLIDKYIITHGTYAPEIVAEIKHALRDGGDFVDVGANIGYLTLVASKISPSGSVYAFEPSPREFVSLLENVRLSAAHNVTISPIALGSSSKTGTLYLQGLDNPGMNSRHRSGVEATIRIERFADVVPPAMLERIRCIKIDVEGDELDVLRGLEPVIDALDATFIVEVSWPGVAEDIYAFFQRHQFAPKFGLEQKPLDEIFRRPAKQHPQAH